MSIIFFKIFQYKRSEPEIQLNTVTKRKYDISDNKLLSSLAGPVITGQSYLDGAGQGPSSPPQTLMLPTSSEGALGSPTQGAVCRRHMERASLLKDLPPLL